MNMIEEYLNGISRQYDDLKSHSDFLASENRKLEQKAGMLTKWLTNNIKEEKFKTGIVMGEKEQIYQEVLDEIIRIDNEIR